MDTTIADKQRAPRVGVCILLLVLMAAATLRFADLGRGSLSQDKDFRLSQVDHGTDLRWFPPLVIPINKVALAVAGNNEFGLRLPTALAGLACVIVLYAFTRRYFDPWAGLCVAAVAAVHPLLVNYGSRVLKEFGYESLFCVLICWAGMAACRQLSRRNIVIFAAICLLGLLIAYSPTLLIGAWLPVLLVVAWRGGDRRALLQLLIVAFVLGLIIGACYLWYSGSATRAVASDHYGSGYHAWPDSYSLAGLAAWAKRAYYGTALILLGIEWTWYPVNWIIGTLEVVAIAAALGICWRRSREMCAAILLLALGLGVVGAARLWPVGAIHAMTFAVPLACIFIGCGLRHIAGRLGGNAATAVLIAGCIAIPGVRAAKHTIIEPEKNEQLRPVLEYVLAEAKAGDGVFVYHAAGSAFQFYWPSLGKDAGRSLDELPLLIEPGSDRGDFEAFRDRFDSFLADHGRVWFIFTHNWRDEREKWIGHLTTRYELVDACTIADASAHLVTRRSPAVGNDVATTVAPNPSRDESDPRP